MVQDLVTSFSDYLVQMRWLEAAGLFFGLLCVWLLIKENIWTWPLGIIYVLISLVIFYQIKLYADLILHVIFLILNIYGWYYWSRGKRGKKEELPVTTTSWQLMIKLIVISAIGIAVSGFLLVNYTDASLPYWDSATSVLSLTGMWLSTKKKIENWYYWFIVDVMAAAIYFYKGIYFYFILYFVYIGLAVVGYLAWRKSWKLVTT